MKGLRYRLTEDEILESLLCLDYKIEGQFKRWNVLILAGIGFALFFNYWKNPDRVYLALGGILTTALLFGIIYMPISKRKRKATQMTKQQGDYQFKLTDGGIIAGNDDTEIPFQENQTVCFDSQNVMTLRVGTQVFCIPKHIMEKALQENLKNLVKSSGGKVYNVKL